MITVAILLPVDNRRYFTIGAILDNRLVLTINRTKLLDYRKNDFHLLCSSLLCGHVCGHAGQTHENKICSACSIDMKTKVIQNIQTFRHFFSSEPAL